MSKKVKIKDLYIGGGNPIAIQSMATCRPSDLNASISCLQELENAGCDIIRFAILDSEDAQSIKKLKKYTKMPIVADIHFDYRLAIESIKNGADKIRINPGNIGAKENVEKVAKVLKEYNIPVRVGSNTGSIDKEYLQKYGRSEISLGESALKNVAILEKFGIDNIVISVKASDTRLTVNSYKYISKKTDYPLHLGVTEAGTEYSGIIKNSIAMGSLLLSGIGDTIRVSLSAPPIKEVIAGKKILSSIGLKNEGVRIIACPTCGRCAWDCMEFAKYVEENTMHVKKPITIAIMGCAVNGPGEAKEADVGIAGDKDKNVIFAGGKIVKTVNKEDAKKVFFEEIEKCLQWWLKKNFYLL